MDIARFWVIAFLLGFIPVFYLLVLFLRKIKLELVSSIGIAGFGALVVNLLIYQNLNLFLSLFIYQIVDHIFYGETIFFKYLVILLFILVLEVLLIIVHYKTYTNQKAFSSNEIKNKSQIKKRPLALNIAVILICLYGIVNIISNITYFYFVQGEGGWISIFTPGLNTTSYMLILIDNIPQLLLFVSAYLIWKRGRFGYYLGILFLILSLPIAISGAEYLNRNITKLFIDDLLYLTKAPPPNMMWYLSMDFNGTTYVNNLTAYRIIMVKSFLKAFIEILSCIFLFFSVVKYKSIKIIKKKTSSP